MIMTKHCTEDRIDRLVYIATHVGWGNVVAEHLHDGHRECLTDTGVILIKAPDEEVLITAYIASMDKAVAIYRDVHGDGVRLPSALHYAIKKNKKFHDNQDKRG